jgi:hypothetical protein
VKKGLAGALTLFAFVFAGVGLSAASFSDVAGDDNAAPDVTAVTVSESPDGVLTLSVAVANYQALPANSWFNIWFDLDSDQSTGDEGDEALVRYVSDGAIEFYQWDGAMLVQRTPDGMSGRYDAGVLTLTAPKSALGTITSFGILAVSSRGQPVGDQELVASDYAPGSGRSAWTGPGLSTYPDPSNDHDAAPDVTSVKVTDAKDGWISFAISTQNYATLPVEDVVAVVIDHDGRAGSDDDESEMLLRYARGDVVLQRWNSARNDWGPDPAPSRVRVRNVEGVVTLDIHRSEIGDVARFGFSIASADFDAAGAPLAVDFAPDDVRFYRYTLVNKPAVRLIAGNTIGTPLQPHAGTPFTVSLPIRRSDTNRAITSGAVTCNVIAGGKKVPAAGRVRAGRAQCTLVVPQNASAVRGSLTVRSGGTTVTARFSFKVR